MEFEELLRQAIAAGRLREPFSAGDAAAALSHEEWPPARVHSFLVRHCRGNLAATDYQVERVSFGKYRLLAGGPREPVRRCTPSRWRTPGSGRRGSPILPGGSDC
jgi:hypothetical protein